MIIRQDMRPKKMIWVQFRKEGIHCYPAAATDPNLATGDEYDVSFLANQHRHIFHFRVWISVTHNDRDIEFIQFKRWLQNLYRDSLLTLDYRSCEMMSDDLHAQIEAKYPSVRFGLRSPKMEKMVLLSNIKRK